MKKNILTSLLLLSFGMGVSTPSFALPDMGGPKISKQQEAEIGKSIYQDLLRYQIISDDIAVNLYLKKIGAKLSQGISNNSFTFTLFGVNDNTINAFAMPGGYIGVNRGLIINTQSESELASVLGHEMAHVTQRHLARMQDNSLANTLLMAAGILAASAAAAGGNGEAAQGLLIASGASSVARQLSYTRDYEREADRLGIKYLADSGFDPHAMPVFFSRLYEINKYTNMSEYPFLLTHPLTVDRIAESQNAAKNYSAKMVPNSVDYLLIREHLRVDTLEKGNAIKYYQQSLAVKQYISEGAQYYGLARAYFKQGSYTKAKEALNLANKQLGNHPYFIDLAATIERKENNFASAQSLYQQGLNQFPQNELLIYGQLETLLDMGQTAQVRKLARTQLSKNKNNSSLYLILAKTYPEQSLERYLALGDSFYYQGLYQAALEKYQQAVRMNEENKSDDFYTRSQLEAKITEIKERRLK